MSRALTGIIKPAYSPHEQYSTDGRLQGPWTDLYAFGATLYRAVTGRPPDDAPIRVTDDRVVAASQAAIGTYRREFLSAIDACLKVQPSMRPRSVADLRPLLVPNAIAKETKIVSQPAGLIAATRIAAARRNRRWAIAAAAAVLLIAASYAGHLYSRWDAEERQRVAAALKDEMDRQVRAKAETQRKAEARERAETDRKKAEEEEKRKQEEADAKRKADEDAKRRKIEAEQKDREDTARKRADEERIAKRKRRRRPGRRSKIRPT